MNATNDELKKAFRVLAKKYHPDRNNGDEESLRKFQEANEAYETLSNESLRKKYDEKLNGFKESNNERTTTNNSDSNRSKNENKRNQYNSESMENLNKYFESYFGFNANTSEINKDKLKKKKDPIDTSRMFENFFNIKRK